MDAKPKRPVYGMDAEVSVIRLDDGAVALDVVDARNCHQSILFASRDALLAFVGKAADVASNERNA